LFFAFFRERIFFFSTSDDKKMEQQNKNNGIDYFLFTHIDEYYQLNIKLIIFYFLSIQRVAYILV